MARCIALLAVFLTVFQASAFLTPSTCRSQSPVVMSAENLNRREFLSKAVAGVAVGAFLGERSASAANYFGDKDAYPAVIKPQDAVIDDELLKSADVQANLTKVKEYSAGVKDMRVAMSKDPQADINKTVRATLEVSKLRNALNGVNVVFDEDTQRGTDRLIRGVVQVSSFQFMEVRFLKVDSYTQLKTDLSY